MVFATSVEHQDLEVDPPFPILEIGLKHILSQLGRNATKAENNSIAAEAVARHSSIVRLNDSTAISTFLALNKRAAPAECGPGVPCIDGSCCNSVCQSKTDRMKLLIFSRKGSVASHHTTVTPRRRRHVSLIVMPMQCVESIRYMEPKNVH